MSNIYRDKYKNEVTSLLHKIWNELENLNKSVNPKLPYSELKVTAPDCALTEIAIGDKMIIDGLEFSIEQESYTCDPDTGEVQIKVLLESLNVNPSFTKQIELHRKAR